MLDTILCDQVYQLFATGQWFSPGTPVSSTNKTDRHDMTEILLKVALNTPPPKLDIFVFIMQMACRINLDRLDEFLSIFQFILLLQIVAIQLSPYYIRPLSPKTTAFIRQDHRSDALIKVMKYY